jgi:tetratricopeptide (TPR) repeat protein
MLYDKGCFEKGKLCMKSTLTSIFAVILSLHCQLIADTNNYKQAAMQQFKVCNYPKAISILKQAALENPNDAEVYYYLGFFTHYLCYDSRPLAGYNESKSDETLQYLHKAISLDSTFGNAYYFIGVEHGARFLVEMQEGNTEKMLNEITAGYEKHGYPDWLIEYCRNLLDCCDSNGILITGGDPDTWPTWYLQYIEDYRTDITIIPLGLLDRPAFALMLKNGFPKSVPGAPISWSNTQILNMHPYKWKTQKISIPVKKEDYQKYGISHEDTVMEWKLKPNLSCGSATLLGAGRALMANIIETNKWKRPIYFSTACPGIENMNFSNHYQLCGLTYKLLPVNAEEYGMAIDTMKIIKVLLNPNNFTFFSDVQEHDMPRASILINNYHGAILRLAEYYLSRDNKEKARDILNRIEECAPESIFPIHPKLKESKRMIIQKMEE